MAVYEQTWSNSCGAATLLCAAYELGVSRAPSYPKYSLWGSSESLELTEHCEKRLYQVTSQHPRSARNPEAWGYSMPSGVAECARVLGLKVKVIAYKTWTVFGLKLSYKAEIHALRAMGVLEEHSSSKSVFKPNPRQRELKVLRGKGGALHYVMVRNNGMVMDPGYGQDLSMAQTKTLLQMHGTGLSIFLQKS